MNVQEREILTRFLQQLAQAQAGTKDADAEKLIQEACARQPDANYLLVQRSLLLEHALENAQAEIARLQSERENTRGAASGFLSGNTWGNSPAPTMPAPRAPGFAPAAPGGIAPASTSSWGSGLLGTVATTAAGVVAGSFLFQGIEHLMGNHGSGAGFLSGNNTPLAPSAPIENVVVNNYADSEGSNFESLASNDSEPDWM